MGDRGGFRGGFGDRGGRGRGRGDREGGRGGRGDRGGRYISCLSLVGRNRKIESSRSVEFFHLVTYFAQGPRPRPWSW